MLRQERTEDQNVMMRAVLEGWQAGIWTALPGIVQSYDPATMSCQVQPAIEAQLRAKDGTLSWVQLPLLVDVPVVFQGGGGFTLALPIAKGDEALVVFSSRCIDAWWQSGGVQVQSELRLHSLSDGFAIVGLRSKPRALAGAALVGTSARLEKDDGSAYVEISAAGVATVKAGTINLQNAGAALKKLVNETFLAIFDAHVHTSSAPGSLTSVPTVPSSAGNKTAVLSAE